MDKFLITNAVNITVTKIGEGRITLSLDPEEAICDRNGRILAFRVRYDGGFRDFLLAPRKSSAYNALKFVEKAAGIFAIGWGFAAAKNQARNTQGATQAMKFLGKHGDQVDKALDGINDFIGVVEWVYYDADRPSVGPVLERPITIRVQIS